MRKAREHPPDLVILDVMMPEAGGVTLFRELKADERLRPGPGDRADGGQEKAFAHSPEVINLRSDETLPPPDAFLEKPLVPEALVALIRRLLPED